MQHNSRLGMFILLLVIGLTMALLTYLPIGYDNSIMQFFIHQHVTIMLVLVVISIGMGYSWSSVLAQQIRKEEKTMQDLLDIVNDLLSRDDRLVIRLLVENNGRISQHEIALHEKMTRVKAHRVVKSLEQRGVVHKEKIGKRVYLHLDATILKRINFGKRQLPKY